MPEDDADGVTVVFEDVRRPLSAAESLSFGREADLVIDAANRSMHRRLGLIRHDEGWVLENLGRSVTLVATDLDGASYARVTPGAVVPIPFANTALAFSCGSANYRMSLHLGRPPSVTAPSEPSRLDATDATLTSTSIVFNDEQYVLLEALARSRFDGPVSPGALPSNRQLARELGWSTTKLTRKLDHLCAKLAKAGLTGLVGDTADTATDRRLRLAEIAVEHRLVRRERT